MVPRPLKGFQCPIHTVFAFVLCFLPPTFIYELRLDIKLTVALDTVRLHTSLSCLCKLISSRP